MPAAGQDERNRCWTSFARCWKSSPLLALFLAIATGYAIGQISFAGVSFGAGAVLFTGLIIGAIAPKAAPPAMVGTIGLVMFVYGVGIQFGPQFFASLRGPGIKYMALATIGVLASLGVAWLSPSRSAFRSQPRPDFRGFRHEHADPAGGLGGGGQSGPGDRLFRVLSLRRGRTDHPDDHHGGLAETEIRAAGQNVRLAELTLESGCGGKTVGELSADLPADVRSSRFARIT